MKLGYELVHRKVKIQQEQRKGCSSSGTSSNRTFVWHINVPEKVQLCAWRLAADAVPSPNHAYNYSSGA